MSTDHRGGASSCASGALTARAPVFYRDDHHRGKALTTLDPQGRPVPLMPPAELATRLSSGLLSFPVTHFDADLQFDEPRYREHLAWQAGFDVAGLFAAGGTGEGFSLTSAEIDRVVRVAVDEIGGRLPVVAPATGGTAQAVAQAQAAQAA